MEKDGSVSVDLKLEYLAHHTHSRMCVCVSDFALRVR